tara:strand:+ start:680 stop:1195 length:516 start_codon:yes stop_codon:yes gene_type:complete
MRLLGLDPGLTVTGWGVLVSQDNRLRYVDGGIVRSSPTGSLSERLVQIHRGVVEVIERYNPEVAAVEETFVNRNPASALKLGQARGALLLTVAMFDMPVHEYAANSIKKAVVGVGHAQKQQVRAMIGALLPGSKLTSSDAADALAVAICHAHSMTPVSVQNSMVGNGGRVT